jgi:hypothetical protein
MAASTPSDKKSASSGTDSTDELLSIINALNTGAQPDPVTSILLAGGFGISPRTIKGLYEHGLLPGQKEEPATKKSAPAPTHRDDVGKTQAEEFKQIMGDEAAKRRLQQQQRMKEELFRRQQIQSQNMNALPEILASLLSTSTPST